MRRHGLEGRSGRLRRHSLTRQAKIAPDIPDLLERDFIAEQPDTRWVTDISSVPTAQGWVYLLVRAWLLCDDGKAPGQKGFLAFDPACGVSHF